MMRHTLTAVRLERLPRLLLLVLLPALLLVLPFRAAAQQNTLAGQVLGPDGAPVPGQNVVLHRVAGGAGATIAEDSTDAAGRFVLRFEGGADADAAYFVAARWQGELYIGPPFRTPVDSTTDYAMQVGVPGTSASALLGTGSGAAPGEPAQGGAMRPQPGAEPFPYAAWLVFIIPLLLAAALAGYVLTRRRGPQRHRRLLLEIAQLDEAFESELAQGDIDDSRRYWAERRALLEQHARES